MLKKFLTFFVLACLALVLAFGAVACTGGGTDPGDGPIGSADPDAV